MRWIEISLSVVVVVWAVVTTYLIVMGY